MFVAVQQQNVRNPVVFGLGATEMQARADAVTWTDADTPADAIDILPCTDALAEAVRNGAVECEIVNGIATVRQ